MPSIVPQAFPFSSIWIGDYGAGVKLTRINSIRTGGCLVAENFPSTYVRAKGGYVQSGNWTCRVDLTFYLDPSEDLPINLARGLGITADPDGVPTNPDYALLLVAPSGKSIYLPRVANPTKGINLTFSKTQCETQKVSLQAETPTVSVPILYRDTLSNLASVMGALYPL